MAEIAIAILGKVSELLIAPIGRQFGYLFKFTGNVETLENEQKKLQDLKNGVKDKVKAAENNVENILDNVETWLKRVDSVDDKARSIVEEKARFPKGCFNNWCLNLKSRYVLSRRANKRTREIIELQQEGKFPEVALPAPPILFMGSTSSTYSDSRELILSKIIEKLKDENINIIGLCGMGGIGKTTMVNEVFKRVKEENMFDDYAMTVVSQRAEMINVEREIAKMLGLNFEENNPQILRAGRLNQRLDGKKVLIIVDDVWEQFDLQSLGITLQDGQSKCKIVFTSRIQGLWMGFRSRRHELSLDPLTEDESWKLFTEKIGDYPNDDPEFVSVARQIANECAGLPLALVVLGSALLRKKEHAWNDTLLKLRKISKTEGKVHESIRLSYDYLDDEEAKSLFLLCSLFKEDSFIDVESLVHMGWGLRLFKGIDRVEEARDRVFALVEDLQSRCLLSIESTGYNHSRWIKIHDVVRDVSKSIARTEKGSLVIENGLTLEASVEESFVERCTWISVISEENKELPPILQFPRLKLLLCNNTNEQAFTIPDSYFEGMVKLQVVDISYFLKLQYRVLKLPSSLQYLTSLHTLCLRNFTLESYSTIKYLQNLEILHIEDPFIEELPNEIGQLSKLRLLDMSDCDSLAKAPPGIISGLSSLEELYLGKLNIDWGEDETEEGRIAVRREFESLSNLRIFHIVIPNPGFLPRTPMFRDLKKYKIHIGHYHHIKDYTYYSQNFERILSINDVDLDKDFNFLVYNAEVLLLTGMTTKRLVYELVETRHTETIRCLEIRHTETPEYLADATDSTKTPCLVSKMESLTLNSLNNLQQIINGPPVAGNIAKLKKLVVLKCRRLKNIFLLSNALDILHLEKLHVSDCEKMEEVFFWEGREKDSTSKLQFPKLVYLKIVGESLVCFCKGANEIEFDQLKRLSLTDIESIISISDENCANPFFPKVVFPKLVNMELSKLKNMKEIWCGKIQSGSFNNLSKLSIKECDSLEYVFTPDMAIYLVHLQTVYIINCPNLKEIVNDPLMIRSLLKLELIRVNSCHQLRNIFQLSTAVDTVNLTRLFIYKCGSMEEVISWEGRPQDSTNNLLFPKLYVLSIKNASSLVCFCIEAMQIEFQQLAHLHLEDIPAIECLVSISNENSLKSFFPHKVVFPKLVKMELSKLKKMKQIWCGQIQSGSFYNMSELYINECDSLEYVFNPDMARYLVHLQSLFIENCPNLKEIVNGPLMVESLLKLKRIRVVSCNQLRNIFRLSIAVDTVDLKSLHINKCESMEEVISWEDRPQDSTNNLLFPNLYVLSIRNASSLVCFCKGAMQIEFQQLVDLFLEDIPAVECLVSISNENSLKSIFPHKVLFPKLTRMHLYKLKNMKDIWCGQLQAGSFNNLSKLCIEECDSLEYVFSSCTARYLVHLRRLVISACKDLKEVVSAKNEVDGIEEYTQIIFPKLEKIKLYKLLSLERFYHVANEIEFPKLVYVGVLDCPAFKSFSPGFV